MVVFHIGVLLQVMACTEPPPGLPTAVEEALEREWVGLNARPCAVDTVGDVRCWNSEIWDGGQIGEEFNEFGIRDLFLDDWAGVLMGINRNDHVVLLACAREGSPQCGVVEGPVSSAGYGLGIRFDGSLVFSALFEEGQVEGMLDTGPWLAIARSGPIGVNARNEIVIPGLFELEGMGDFVSEVYLRGRPVAVVGDHGFLSSEYLGGCVLDDTGVIACAGNTHWTSMRFENGPYRWLDGGEGTACAVRAVDHVIECHDGSTYDWGPLIDFAAYGYSYRDEDGFWKYGWEASPSVCAITLANEIKCAGPRYGDDLLEALEETNDRNRRSLPLGLWGLPW